MHTAFRPVVVLLFLLALPARAQEGLTVEVTPATLTLEVGQTAPLTAHVVDANGMTRDVPVLFFSRDRRGAAVDRRTGVVTALAPGTHTVVALARLADGTRVVGEATVEVPTPPVAHVSFAGLPDHLYAGTVVPVPVAVVDASDTVREDVPVTRRTSDPAVATFDAFGALAAHEPGVVTLTAEAEGVRAEVTVEVVPSPIVRLAVTAPRTEARTGDVIPFEAVAYDADGAVVADAPIAYAVMAAPEARGPAAAAQVDADGRFVAALPGHYTVVATTGTQAARRTVHITPRRVGKRVEVVGHGTVADVHTSDLWVWEGIDGRDYAVTGTWSASGNAYFWDVTDPATPVIIDTVTVDARTVNDVKVNARGDVCVISREGASNRRNGLVILDCSDPHDVKVLSRFDDGLTGGVHNVFLYDHYLFAVNNGQRYDILDIADPAHPRRVGRFELDTPGHAVHDVWVVDGIAYSSNWGDGVWMVDVGNGVRGGSPENPVVIGHYAYPSGWNHAAFPYRSKDTGKFYIIAGDEAFPYEQPYERAPEIAAGWIHFIDFTDPEHPKEVARYEVPEAGTHNFWVEDDKLYIGYYNGGLRVVDISGDLMGDLYRQGREIARFLSFSPEAYIPNASMVWGPQPYKGHVFFADHYSGLWVVKLVDEEAPKPGT